MSGPLPWEEENIDIISSDENSSSVVESEDDDGIAGHITEFLKELTSEDALLKKAETYQEYMKQVKIPTKRGSVIPFNSWVGLGRSIKEMYGQPLHYLTNICLNQWDQQRLGSEDEHTHLDIIIHPRKAEATVWLMEETHRLTTSHYHLAKLWESDTRYHAFIDSIFPVL